jgi:hypothetical protein
VAFNTPDTLSSRLSSSFFSSIISPFDLPGVLRANSTRHITIIELTDVTHYLDKYHSKKIDEPDASRLPAVTILAVTLKKNWQTWRKTKTNDICLDNA